MKKSDQNLKNCWMVWRGSMLHWQCPRLDWCMLS